MIIPRSKRVTRAASGLIGGSDAALAMVYSITNGRSLASPLVGLCKSMTSGNAAIVAIIIMWKSSM
jgi:hypothetical protein